VKKSVVTAASMILFIAVAGGVAQEQPSKDEKKRAKAVSFKTDVFPIIEGNCLPCHAENEFNPSELYMDSYELIAEGGKHGAPWVPGKPGESIMIQKVGEDPPFEARMPLNPKKKIKEGKAKWLSEEDVRILSKWIEQGAKDN